jgi:hypothetical protein
MPGIVWLLCLYAIVGWFAFLFCDGELDTDEAAAVGFLWPIFLVAVVIIGAAKLTIKMLEAFK